MPHKLISQVHPACLVFTLMALFLSPPVFSQGTCERIMVQDSTLNNLINFPIDFIKVDKGFVQKITTKQGRGLIKTIIAMGQDLDMEVIIEGIETEEQLETLCSLQCEFGQGYHLARPIDPAYLDIWVATRLGTDSLKLR